MAVETTRRVFQAAGAAYEKQRWPNLIGIGIIYSALNCKDDRDKVYDQHELHGKIVNWWWAKARDKQTDGQKSDLNSGAIFTS